MAYDPIRNYEAHFLNAIANNFSLRSNSLISCSLWTLENLILEVQICDHPAFAKNKIIAKAFNELTRRHSKVNSKE